MTSDLFSCILSRAHYPDFLVTTNIELRNFETLFSKICTLVTLSNLGFMAFNYEHPQKLVSLDELFMFHG